jgi:hypothetical protein
VGYAAVEPPIPEPERLLVPYGNNWRDRWGLNEMIVEGMFPKRGSVLSAKLISSYCGAGSMEQSDGRRCLDVLRKRSVVAM